MSKNPSHFDHLQNEIMSDELLQAIVEKLESLELAWKVSGDAEKERLEKLIIELGILRNDLQNLPTQILPVTIKTGELSTAVDNLYRQLKIPVQNRIEHKHELHKGILIAISLFLINIVLIWLLMTSYQSHKMYIANDIKYRHLRITGNKQILKLCKTTDSLYQKDESSFRNNVEMEEQRLIRQAKNFRLADEKEKEAKDLRNRATGQ